MVCFLTEINNLLVLSFRQVNNSIVVIVFNRFNPNCDHSGGIKWTNSVFLYVPHSAYNNSSSDITLWHCARVF